MPLVIKAAVSALLVVAVSASAPACAAPPPERPYSCRLLDDEQRKCAFGSCDARTSTACARNAYETEGGHERGFVGRRDDRGGRKIAILVDKI
jgi:hypothetical protein